MSLLDCVVEGNTAVRGGGVYIDSSSQFDLRASSRAERNRVKFNRAVEGGAFFLILKSSQKNTVQVRCVL